MAAWMSVMRALNPITSLAYWRSMPWLRRTRDMRATSSDGVVIIPPSPDVMFFVG